LRRHLPVTAAAVTATAVLGSIGTDVQSPWYAALHKPRWQPPGPVFGPAWTLLYGLLTTATARTLDRMPEGQRSRYATALGVNLALNAGWNWLFFRARRPRWALAEILALEASTVDLIQRSGRYDRTAARLLLPYAAWVGFATALTGSIARRNKGR
jgi:translocator protein